MMPHAADKQAEANKPITHDHNHGIDHVAGKRRIALAAERRRDNERYLDDRYGDGQDQRAKRLAGKMRKPLRLCHRRDHGGEQKR